MWESSVSGLGRSPGGGNGNPLHYSCWKISQTEESGRLQSKGLQRIGHNWAANTQQVCHGFSSKEQVSFNFITAVTICSGFGAQENKVSLFPLLPHLFAMKWWDRTPWSSLFWMLSFKPAFSLSSFIKRLFSYSSLSAVSVVSSAYLLLIFLPQSWIQPVLHPARHSSCCTLHLS